MAEARDHTPLTHPDQPERRRSSTSYTATRDSFFDNSTSYGRNAKLATAFVLINVFLERLGFYIVGNNLVAFSKGSLNFTTNQAVTVSSTFAGTSYFLPLFGGILADSVLGNYNTIYGGLFLELLGMIFFIIMSSLVDIITKTVEMGLFFSGLCFICLGQGFIRGNVAIFGAEQLSNPTEEKIDAFYRIFYWAINLGAFFAFLPFSLFLNHGRGNLIDSIVALVTIALALTIYIFGKRTYNIAVREGPSTLFQLFRSICLKRQYREDDELTLNSTLNPHQRLGVKERQLIRHLSEMVKIFGTLMLFITVYTQISSTYVIQAVLLDRNIGSFHLARSFIPIFDPLVVLIAVPMVHFVFVPALKKYGKKPRRLNGMAIGMLFASASALSAAVLEVIRHVYHERGVKLSIFCQIPQFVFMGTGEIFTIISGYQFAFHEAPSGMRGLTVGLFICSWGLGSYLGIFLTWIVNISSNNIWYPDNFDEGNAEYFLFLLSALSIMASVLLKFFTHGYISIKEREILIRKEEKDYRKECRSINRDAGTRRTRYDTFEWSTSSSEEEDPELRETLNRFLRRGRVGSSPPPSPV